MFAELLLYTELLLFLVGTLLYGFLTRELLRRPEVLAGNRAVRALLISLTVWYGGTLVDYLVPMLVGDPPASVAGTLLDLARGSAWLLSLSLVAHSLARVLADAEPPARRGVLRFATLAAYLPLALFVEPFLDFARAGGVTLGEATQAIYPRVILHAVLTLAVAGVLTARLTVRLEDRRLVDFLKLLAGVLGALLSLLVLSAFFRPWSEDAAGWDRFLRTLLLGGLLLPGSLFAFYVQRHNLLRLTVSHRTLRHFVGVLLLALLAMLAGPAAGMEDLTPLRRLVAWGLLTALFLGTAYRPLSDLALRRFPALRNLLGKTLSPEELDRLMDTIQNLDAADGEALTRTAGALGDWLGSDASFLPSADVRPELEPFWAFFDGGNHSVAHRLDPPPSLASLLTREKLHAVFPLRVDGRLEALLGLGTSTTGGGYADGELEAVRLVLRQLAASLTLRRLVRSRIAEERRLGEQERLSMLGLVSASLAHEIKNPLSSMKVLAQALREDLAASDETSEGVADLDLIVEQIDRLDQTTREILGIARPRSGDATELTPLVESAVYVLRAEAKKRGTTLTPHLEDVGQVPGSPASWQTIVFNLILNAVEHAPSGSEVTIRLTLVDGRALFETLNPGQPVSADHLFEPFVSDDGGTGLGLALVARRLRELGAEIDVTSSAGTVHFRVIGPPSTSAAPLEATRKEGRDAPEVSPSGSPLAAARSHSPKERRVDSEPTPDRREPSRAVRGSVSSRPPSTTSDPS